MDVIVFDACEGGGLPQPSCNVIYQHALEVFATCGLPSVTIDTRSEMDDPRKQYINFLFVFFSVHNS